MKRKRKKPKEKNNLEREAKKEKKINKQNKKNTKREKSEKYKGSWGFFFQKNVGEAHRIFLYFGTPTFKKWVYGVRPLFE